MPNNEDVGMLEDFLIDMAPQPSIQAVMDCLEMASANGHTAFKDLHQSKAVIHTYLAWQDEPGKPLGQSITARALRPETQTAKNFADWLMELFAEGAEISFRKVVTRTSFTHISTSPTPKKGWHLCQPFWFCAT